MPIKVSCQCGQQFAAKDEFAGKVVKCPKCKRPLTIGATSGAKQAPAPAGAPSAVAALLDEVGFHVHKDKEEEAVQRCPACDAKISDHAVLCVYCGFHLESGKFVKGVAGSGPGAITQKAEGHEGVAQLLLKRAEQTIETDKDEERKMRTQGMPMWMIITILSIIATFAVGMSVLPRHQAIMISGCVWVGVCALTAFVFQVRLLIIAFTESVACGLMYLFVPFYALYYVITRWDQCGKLFLISFFLSIVQQFGWFLIAMAPRFEEAPSQDVRLRVEFPVALACAMLDPSGSKGLEDVARRS